jgi:serine/threonine protein kinase
VQPLLTSEPSRVGDYRLLARLGKGAMGAVYLARSRGGRIVAVKVVRGDLAEDAEFRERFRRETMAARAVGGFWTAAVVDADPDAELPWLATEYVPGPTLHQAVVDHGPLPEHTVGSLAAGLAEALQAVHRAHVVHRDLKPANVLLGPDGPRVIDFGISRAMTASAMTATGMFFGTPGFFSPEQTIGDEVGPPSDVFSLGAVLTFASTGNGPFGDEHTAAMLYRVVHTEPDLSRVPDGLRPLIAASLAKDPEDRPTTAVILDQIGEPSPQGNQWLPPAITATIAEHNTQLQQTAAAADASPPADQKPNTRTYTTAQPAPAPAPTPASPSDVERTDTILPAVPKSTAQQPVPASAPPKKEVAKKPPRPRLQDQPGPVFTVGGRIGALFTAVVMLGLIVGIFALGNRFGVPPDMRGPFQLAVTCFGISGVLSLLKVVAPALCLKINGQGLRVYRLGASREIPWSQVMRVGVVGRGKKQYVAVWVADNVSPARTTWWHRVRRYHGGARIFPIGATGGWWKRRQEVKRVRLALHQYAPRAYDPRLL